MDQHQEIMIAIAVAVVLLIVIIAVVVSRRKRAEHLRSQFGPEYDRAVAVHGSKADSLLAEREKRVQGFTLHHLSEADRTAFANDWEAVQRRFVDDPAMAVREADTLVARVMSARGYPVADFDQRAADVSVHYPGLVENYRGAREISLRHANGQASTEDLRQAMVHYRSLFNELLEAPKAAVVRDEPVVRT